MPVNYTRVGVTRKGLSFLSVFLLPIHRHLKLIRLSSPEPGRSPFCLVSQHPLLPTRGLNKKFLFVRSCNWCLERTRMEFLPPLDFFLSPTGQQCPSTARVHLPFVVSSLF